MHLPARAVTENSVLLTLFEKYFPYVTRGAHSATLKCDAYTPFLGADEEVGFPQRNLHHRFHAVAKDREFEYIPDSCFQE